MGETSYPTGDLSMPEEVDSAPAFVAPGITSYTNVPEAGEETFDFPADVPVAEMTLEQRSEYWREKAQKHEKRAKQLVPPDYAELKRYREQAEQAKLTDTEKAIQQARAEGAAEVTTRTLTAAAVAIYRAGLSARGVPAEELNDLVDAFNAGKFIKDGDIDTDRISVIAARIAGTAKADGKQWPDMGQGRRPTSPVSGREAGKAEAERRFGRSA